MAFIKFVRGLEATYTAAANTTYKDAVFFATDTHKLYLNGIAYGGEDLGKVVNEVALNAAGDGLVIQYNEGAQKEIKFPVASVDARDKKGLLSWNDFKSAKYESALPDDLTTPNAVGGITKGTKVADLKSKTLDQIIDDLLFPEVNPTINAPSASISLKAGFSTNDVYEIGATAPVAGTNLTGSANLGKITVAGKPDMTRAGEKTAERYLYGSSETLPEKITLGQMTYKYQFDHAEGPQPVTSKGNNFGSKLPAGTVTSGDVSIYGTYPYFSNGKQASTSANELNSLPTEMVDKTKFTSLFRIDNNAQIAAKFASEASTGVKAKLYVPASKKVTKVMAMNALTGKFDVAITAWEMAAETVQMEVQGQQVDYKVWQTTGGLAGGNQYLFTIANA